MDLSITLILIVITVIISLRADSNPELKSKLILNAYQVKHNKQYYRLITSGFIHSGYVHLGFNMFSFYWFGQVLEVLLTKYFNVLTAGIIYVLFYLISIVISDLPSVFKHGDSGGYNSLGASGGVSAVVFACIMFFPLGKINLLFIPGEGIPGFLVGTLYLMYSYFQGKNIGDNINHDAHLYGALFGIVFSITIHPPVIIEFFQQLSSWDGFF